MVSQNGVLDLLFLPSLSLLEVGCRSAPLEWKEQASESPHGIMKMLCVMKRGSSRMFLSM